MKIADIEHIKRIRSPEDVADRRHVIGEAEFDALCRAAARGADDAVEPMLRQIEYVADEMRQYHPGNVKNHAVVSVGTLERWRDVLEIIRRGLAGREVPGRRCSATEHWSVPGLNRCYCGGFDLHLGTQKIGRHGRPVIWAEVAKVSLGADIEPRVKFGDETYGVAVELPPNCSINLDIDLNRGDAAAPFIRVRRGPGGVLAVDEISSEE